METEKEMVDRMISEVKFVFRKNIKWFILGFVVFVLIFFFAFK